MVDNEKRTINVNGAKISIAFITNTYVERINEERFDNAIGDGIPG